MMTRGEKGISQWSTACPVVDEEECHSYSDPERKVPVSVRCHSTLCLEERQLLNNAASGLVVDKH